MSLVRLGLAISGGIWKWEAISWAAGVSSGLSAGAIIDWVNDQHFGSKLYDLTHPDPLLNTSYLAARRYTQPRRDPLDLDNDGLETLGINAAAPILFDHDGTGIKTASGWLKPDDAFLVLDRNGNGLIDSGRELFGDATVKSNGQLARDGFDALADLDGNADGQISTLDSAYARLKLWRDLNQDGVSQANELSTLGQAGIASIKVVSSAHSQTLANGNEIADLGTFTRSDGSTGTTGEITGRLADINLANNPFYRQFTDTLDTAAVADLPDLQGSGAVRDLREAASLSPTLADSLRQLVAHAATGTRADFRNAVLALIDQWADSAQFSDSFARAAAADQDLFFVPPGVSVLNAYNAHYGIIYAGPNGTLSDTPAHQQRIRDQQAQIERLLKTLETFNGLHFVAVPDNESTTSRPPSTLVAVSVPETGGGSGSILPDAPAPLIYALEQDRLNLLQQSHQALRQSVQDGLALQTRLRPLLDTLALQIDAQGARLDFSALDAEIDRRLATDAQEGFGDLIDFNRATRSLLKDSGWTGWEKVADLLANDPQQDSFRSVLAEEGALVKGMAGFSSAGGNGDDWLVGDGGADLLQGNDGDDVLLGLGGNDTSAAFPLTRLLPGDDVLLGLGGNDTLSSGSGDDQLDGGAEADTLYAGLGNDLLLGGTGNDSLFANEGDDSLDGGQNSGARNRLSLPDYLKTELTLSRTGDTLELGFTNGKLKGLRSNRVKFQFERKFESGLLFNFVQK
jgi:hypothetical protein